MGFNSGFKGLIAVHDRAK